MKPILQEEEEVNLDPETLFINSIKSKATKRAYLIYLQKFMNFVKAETINDLIYNFKDKDPKDIERRIIEFIIRMKKEGGNFGSIHNYVAPVITFYKINDIILNTKKINMVMPAKTRVRKNRGYEYEEIQKLLEIADERMRAVILLLVSGGMRIGSINTLHVRDLEKCGDIYKVTVYENQEEEYFTFITPEASKAVDDYLDMRRRYGEQIGPDSILIREQFDIRDPFSIASPKTVSTITLTGKITQLAERAGLRERIPLKEGEKRGSIRKPVQVAHGFRKSFTTFAHNAKMDIIKRRMLECHSVGIDEHYLKPQESDLLEEYMKGLDNLTINPENRLRREVKMLKIEKSKVDLALSQIEEMKKRLRL